MGAEFVYERLKATTREEAMAEVKEIIEECLFECGHCGYTGTFAEGDGVVVVDIEMEDYKEALDWLLENCKKWGPVLVVKTRADGYIAGAWCST